MFNVQAETMPVGELRKLQGQRLRALVERAYDHVPFYRTKMLEQGVKPEDIRSIEDVVKLPFITKADFREQYPFGMFGVPQKEIVRIHASSGTTGKPTVVGYTRARRATPSVRASTIRAGTAARSGTTRRPAST